MDFLSLAKTRQSVRAYRDKQVEREKLERCIKAAAYAPSACNAQPWSFVIVDDPELKENVAKQTYGKIAAFNKFTAQSPVLIAIVVEKDNIIAKMGGIVKKKPYYYFDTGIACEHICLQAVEEGLGTCIIGWFNEQKIKELLDIPNAKEIALLLSIGYPADTEIKPKKRKEFAEIISYNSYC